MNLEDILVGVFIVVAIAAGVCAWWFENKSTGMEAAEENDRNVVIKEKIEK